MALSPETIARIQGIMDGTIKVPENTQPTSIKNLRPETRARLLELLSAPLPAMEEPKPTTQEIRMANQEPTEESLSNADEIIQTLADNGQGDYGAFRREIALDIYENGHFNGNWDVCFNPDEYGNSELNGFRVIQEDEYDQHMDEDEDKPDYDDMVADVPNGYLWML